MRKLAITILGSLAFASPALGHTTLSTPISGAPVQSRYQLWIKEDRMPTPQGVVIIMTQSQLCFIPGVAFSGGCSETIDSDSHIFGLAAVDQQAFYFELGHIVDWRDLTTVNRIRLAQMWKQPHAVWNDSPKALAVGQEDGLEVDFAASYAACAEGTSPEFLQSGEAPFIQEGSSCSMIRSIVLHSR
jgi:hypothetical protein